ncbi:hypothetical protein [Fidelibacter multiformis]|uniref:hypothetical protein n=1 Tax=Fidelibacter multiformis TaxID=3377529 RepID=UPI0037DD3C1F
MESLSWELRVGWGGRAECILKKAIYPVDNNDKKEKNKHVLLNTFSGRYFKKSSLGFNLLLKNIPKRHNPLISHQEAPTEAQC